MSATPRWRRQRRFATTLAVVGVAAACTIAATASARSTDTITLRVSLFGDFGYHDLYKQYEERTPDINDQGGHPELRRPPHEPRQAPRDRRGRRRHRGDRGRLHRPVQGAAAELLRPEPVRRRLAEGPLAAVEVAAVDRAERRPDRPRHGRRQPRDLLPRRPVQEGRPADATATPSRSSGRPGRRTSPPASASRRTRRRASHFFDSGSNVFNAIIGQLNPAYYDVARQGRSSARTRGQDGVGPDHAGHPGTTRAPASPRSRPTGTPASRRARSRPSPARRG